MIQFTETTATGKGDTELLRRELLHELFERQARERSGELAVICGAEQMTYGELDRASNRLARHLRRRGAGRDACVALLLPRSLQMYVALLAVLKAGAAYVPMDPTLPAERVRFMLADCQARVLVTTRGLAGRAEPFAGELVAVDECGPEIAAQSSARLGAAETGAGPDDLCHVIYTSGSTGRPKGVQVEHRSVCHLVRAEGRIFQVRPQDRVYQGFSLAFDASVEEIWLAFHAGATLVAGTEETSHGAPTLAAMLNAAGVTVLSCVPTLLAMIEEDLPGVRLLILGGETCPPDIVRRWWKPDRRVVNTYGPTEATVIATYADCHPGKPVTIGRPLPNYFACILDGQMRPVAPGVAGELCLGGIGLARGYAGRLDLTREKFVPNPLAQGGGDPPRLYKTGDLARWTPEGEIEFLGRIDTQVKIRGFRVELSEIESVLLEQAEVKAAAVVLREDSPGNPQLTGYIVPRGDRPPDAEQLRARLRTRLPDYMIPSSFETLAELPLLPSGKVDRKSLPAPRAGATSTERKIVPPVTALERQIHAAWEKCLAPAPVSIQDDFFLDLGGHSLLAARMVSELRRQPRLQSLSMLDVYRHPTIAALAAEFEARGPAGAEDTGPGMVNAGPRMAPFWRHFICGAAQAVSLVFLLGFFAAQWLTPYLVYTMLIEEEYGFPTAIVGAFASLIVFYLLMLLVPIIVKWTVIGRYRPGSYPLWGTYYFRFWFATTIESAVPVGYLAGTPLLSIYLRLMGAKIGRTVYLASDAFAIYDLLSIGDDTSINDDSNLPGYTVENGRLNLGRITIGRNCFVGTRSAVREDTVMGNGAALEDLSLLPRGTVIPAGETWAGSPARRTGSKTGARPAGAQTARPGAVRRFGFGMLHAIGLLIFPVLVAAAVFPGIVLMNQLNYMDPYYWYLCLSPMVGLSFVVLLCLEIAVLKWLVLGRVEPGTYALDSFFYLRKWFVDQTMELSLETVGPLYGSVYLAPWYRVLGAEVGRGAEVSTASFISPDLLSLGEESFIADSVSLGAPRVRDGCLTLDRNRVGRRSFIGNSAMLPPGAAIGDNCLIGCLSAPPADPADALREGTSWMGSPAIFLPQRQPTTGFPAEATFNPPLGLRAQRAAIEFVRVILPSTCFIILLSLMFSALLLLRDYFTVAQTLWFCVPLYLACGLAAALFTIIVKWALVGRYRPGEKPLWSNFVWRNELLNALHEHLAEPFLVGALSGTPFICWYFRLLGARIGRRVYLETTDFSEFDLARIGHGAALNADCTIQTHLFEDRVMKMSTIDIAAGASVGAGSLVLYDTRMEAGAALGDLSLLMKGETLPAGTSWEGIPAGPRRARG